MKVEINNIEVVFKNNDIMGTKIWFTNLSFQGREIYVELDEHKVLLNLRAGEIQIDEKLLVDVAKHILDNMEIIQSKGAAVLTELHKQVFGEHELLRGKGYFQMEEIRLTSVEDVLNGPSVGRTPYFEYEVFFFLESELNWVMDPYYSYSAQFSNHQRLTMVGVSRIG